MTLTSPSSVGRLSRQLRTEKKQKEGTLVFQRLVILCMANGISELFTVGTPHPEIQPSVPCFHVSGELRVLLIFYSFKQYE